MIILFEMLSDSNLVEVQRKGMFSDIPIGHASKAGVVRHHLDKTVDFHPQPRVLYIFQDLR
jgi:hypothetical protein